MKSDNARAALLMTAGQAAFLVNDACMKALSSDLPLFQAIFLRGLVTTALLALLARATGQLRLRLPAREARLVALRTLGEIGAAGFFITALFHMPLANASAILQALPLALTLAGAVFLREPVGWRRLAAILIGFAGVLIVIRPGPEGFNVYSLHALASVACVTLRDLATRRLGPVVPSLTVAFWAAAGVTAFAGLGLTTTTLAPVTPEAALKLGGAVVGVFLGYLAAVRVMRIGDLAFVAPFRYTALLWALLLGWLAFGDWPDALTLAGAGLIAATGLFTLWRERRAALKPPPEPDRTVA